jgi:hypothetical protein
VRALGNLASVLVLAHEKSKVQFIYGHNGSRVPPFLKTPVFEQKTWQNFVSHGFHAIF